MNRTSLTIAVAVIMFATDGASAEERMVPLVVENMTCEATCPYIVKQALSRLPDVVRLSFPYSKVSR